MLIFIKIKETTLFSLALEEADDDRGYLMLIGITLNVLDLSLCSSCSSLEETTTLFDFTWCRYLKVDVTDTIDHTYHYVLVGKFYTNVSRSTNFFESQFGYFAHSNTLTPSPAYLPKTDPRFRTQFLEDPWIIQNHQYLQQQSQSATYPIQNPQINIRPLIILLAAIS